MNSTQKPSRCCTSKLILSRKAELLARGEGVLIGLGPAVGEREFVILVDVQHTHFGALVVKAVGYNPKAQY